MKSMTSRERVRAALNHKQPDRVPLDLGTTPVTGIHVSTYARLRKALGLPGRSPKVEEPYQMLAYVEPEVADRLGLDTVGLSMPTTIFGFPNVDWKPFRTFDGTDVLVSEYFRWMNDSNGDLLLYPAGDTSVPPSGRMPKGGNFFDAIPRQEPNAEEHLVPREFAEQQIAPYTDEQLKYLQKTADELYRTTDKAIVGCWWQGGIGDIALVPGLGVPKPKGIRDPQRWYEMLMEEPGYSQEIFEIHIQIAMKNLKLYRDAVGDKIDVLVVSGTDFGSQRGPFFSPKMYRDVFKKHHKRINDWVHKNTKWKTFYHTCGSVVAFLDDFAEAGVDILNPVQCSATGMAADELKAKYGDKFTFWGGGIDTQRVLPFGSPQEVRQQVEERVRTFGKNGGFVFNTIHNIQNQVPVENLMTMFETLNAVRGLPTAQKAA